MKEKLFYFDDDHYKGISVLQDYYGKRLKTSNSPKPELQWYIRKRLEQLKLFKGRQRYNPREQEMLNRMRDEYYYTNKKKLRSNKTTSF
tara:strand:- start:29 stop:295 length:267 start_codon:yes stop_codon:yes gene_type:complete